MKLPPHSRTNASGTASRSRSLLKIGAVVIPAFFCLTLAGAEEPVFPYLPTPPAVDGKVDPSEWASAGHAELKHWSGTAPERTEVYYGRNDRNFYAAFVCYDGDIQSLRRQHLTPEERDNAIWLDDSVELRLDPWNSPLEPEHQRQVIVNANGIVYDAVGKDRERNFNCNVQTSVSADRWTVELAIPLRELCGYTPGNAELWRLALARNLVRRRDFLTLTGHRGESFAEPGYFVTFRSGPLSDDRPFTVTGISKDGLHWRRDSSSGQPLTAVLTPLLLDGQAAGAGLKSILSAKDETGVLALDPPKNAALWRLSAPGGYVLEWEVTRREEASGTVRFTENPLYRELWSDGEPGMIRDGTKIWAHGFWERFLPIAMEFAIPWDQVSALQTLYDNKLMVLGTASIFLPDWENLLNRAPKGMKFAVIPRYYDYRKLDVPKDKRGPLFIAPEAVECWKAAFVQKFKPFREHISDVMIGDENAETTERFFLRLMTEKSAHPVVTRIVERIRNEHGFGKFGPPESFDDPDPYRWIAMRSFFHAELIRIHKEFKEMLDREFPGVRFYSDSIQAGQSKIYDYADFTPDVCDIVNFQLYPSHHPLIADYSFLPKYISDLSPVKEIWPSAHVENYGEQYTPQETLEKLSETIRAGATGLTWYIWDSRGARVGRSLDCDYYGAPERWQVETAVTREMGSMPPLIRPEPDCALFTAMATVRAIPGVQKHPHRAQMIQSLLEIGSGVFFRYCNETTIDRSPLDPNRCKAVFAADAKYCPLKTFEQLEQYVRQGGKLIVTDPSAFLFTPDAQPLPRERLLGITGMEPRSPDRFFQFGETVLPLKNAESWTLRPAPGAEAVAVYADGKPAAVKYACGKGEVWFFGVDFAAADQIRKPVYHAWSRTSTEKLGLKLDQPIWRFCFPEELIVPVPVEKGKCLTGNFIRFQNFRPITDNNLPVRPDAKYTYSLAPDAPAEPLEVSFGRGKLTDRIRAYQAGNVDGKKAALADRLVGWSSTEGFDILFDLGETDTVSRIDLFYQGGMRDISVALSKDGKEYHPAGTFPASPGERVSLAVAKKELILPEARQARFIRLTFGKASSAAPIVTQYRNGWTTIRELKLVSALPLTKANFQLFEVELWK